MREQPPFAAPGNEGPGAARAEWEAGQRALRAADTAAARAALRRAHDLDVVRFRAPTSFNEIIRRVAAAEQATYVPVAEAFEQAAPGGMPGRELLLEHVHPTRDGVVLMARTFYEALRDARFLGHAARDSALRPWAEYRERMALSPFDERVGVAFAGSFVAAPCLRNLVGVPGIFALTGILALAAVAIVTWVVPDPPARHPGHVPLPFGEVLRNPELARLNVGIFALHVVLMALFVVVPLSLVRAGLPSAEHWSAYLGAVGVGFLLMLPFVAVRRIARHERAVFLGSVALLAAGIAVLAASADRLLPLGAGLIIFFTAFNVLEAKLPALVSKAAPPTAKGAASGV